MTIIRGWDDVTKDELAAAVKEFSKIKARYNQKNANVEESANLEGSGAEASDYDYDEDVNNQHSDSDDVTISSKFSVCFV